MIEKTKIYKDHNSIDARQLQLTYSDGTEAVQGISLEVPRGEFFGFLGPNGAGKTTFIKMLVTLLRPTEGKACVNGFGLEENPRQSASPSGTWPKR